MNPSLRAPVDPLACPECGTKCLSEMYAHWHCRELPAPVDDYFLDPPEKHEMTEAQREELLAGAPTDWTPEEIYTDAVNVYIEARRAVQEEELRRAEIELVAIEELVTNGQARSQTAAKEMKTLHPDYRKHKERLNALELAVTRAEALVEVRKSQMWRATLTAGITEAA